MQPLIESETSGSNGPDENSSTKSSRRSSSNRSSHSSSSCLIEDNRDCRKESSIIEKFTSSSTFLSSLKTKSSKALNSQQKQSMKIASVSGTPITTPKSLWPFSRNQSESNSPPPSPSSMMERFCVIVSFGAIFLVFVLHQRIDFVERKIHHQYDSIRGRIEKIEEIQSRLILPSINVILASLQSESSMSSPSSSSSQSSISSLLSALESRTNENFQPTESRSKNSDEDFNLNGTTETDEKLLLDMNLSRNFPATSDLHRKAMLSSTILWEKFYQIFNEVFIGFFWL